jgi:addiction module HigA family antidote
MARIAIHPGEHLAEELDALGMSAAALARQLQVPTNRVTAILHGQRSITGDTALRLAHFFGTSAESVRIAAGRTESGKVHQGAAPAQATRARATGRRTAVSSPG